MSQESLQNLTRKSLQIGTKSLDSSTLASARLLTTSLRIFSNLYLFWKFCYKVTNLSVISVSKVIEHSECQRSIIYISLSRVSPASCNLWSQMVTCADFLTVSLDSPLSFLLYLSIIDFTRRFQFQERAAHLG
jgi:hypothetical protein